MHIYFLFASKDHPQEQFQQSGYSKPCLFSSFQFTIYEITSLCTAKPAEINIYEAQNKKPRRFEALSRCGLLFASVPKKYECA